MSIGMGFENFGWFRDEDVCCTVRLDDGCNMLIGCVVKCGKRMKDANGIELTYIAGFNTYTAGFSDHFALFGLGIAEFFVHIACYGLGIAGKNFAFSY